MTVITNATIKEVSLPFPNFQPNTRILSEQVNDNNDELQYRTNLLIKAFNLKVQELLTFEGNMDDFEERYNQFVEEVGRQFTKTNKTVATNKEEINKRVDNEVETLNTKIEENNNNINKRADDLQKSKGDNLQLKNTLLYLKSGEENISVADLSGLGGGTGRSVNVAFGQIVASSAWTLDEEEGLYYVNITHRLNTSTPFVSFNDGEGFNMFDMFKVVDKDTVTVYVDKPLDTYIAVINGSSSVEFIQAILDDTQITELRTWSSKKIQEELDKKSTDAGSTLYDNSHSGLTSTTVQGAIDEIYGSVNTSRIRIIQNYNSIVNKVVGGGK